MENTTIDIVAITDIAAGSEITINYHGEPGDDTPLWF
jgi:SET domain-containing protein